MQFCPGNGHDPNIPLKEGQPNFSDLFHRVVGNMKVSMTKGSVNNIASASRKFNVSLIDSIFRPYHEMSLDSLAGF